MPSSLGRGFVLVALVAAALGFGSRELPGAAWGSALPFELGVREARAQGSEVFVPCAIGPRADATSQTDVKAAAPRRRASGE